MILSFAHRWARPGCILLVLTLAVACERPVADAAYNASTSDGVRRLASILDYVAADYSGAVVDGKIVSSSEYQEQLAFLEDAATLLTRLPASAGSELWHGQLSELRGLVSARAPSEGVVDAARALRRSIMDGYGVVVAPVAPPSLARGQELYRVHCTGCHGLSGAADTMAARTLTPHPRSFIDPQTMASMSPRRVFNALTDGLPGTAMPSFGQLSAADRWSLAFYVFTFRQSLAAAAQGRSRLKSIARMGSAGRLAGMTDDELRAELAAAGLDAAAQEDAVAYARLSAPYVESGAPFDRARALLAAAGTAHRKHDGSAARQLAVSAYLEGVEPHEAALGAAAPDLVRHLESEFLALREAIVRGDSADGVERRTLRIGVLLDEADRRLTGSGGAKVAFVTTAVIIAREGLEAALLVLLLLGIARRAGAGARDVQAIHGGWAAALILGVALWFASGALLTTIGGASRELLEGVVSLFAATVLLGVSHFVLARLDAQRRVAALKERLVRAVASSGRRVLVFASLSFVAVFREIFEVVLFLRAVMLDAGVSAWAIGAGAAAGLVALLGLVVLLGRLGSRLKPAALLSALGSLLCLLATALAGKGVRALQEAGAVGITSISAPRVEWLGVYPTVETLVAQGLVLVAFAVLASWALIRSRAAAQATASRAI